MDDTCGNLTVNDTCGYFTVHNRVYVVISLCITECMWLFHCDVAISLWMTRMVISLWMTCGYYTVDDTMW